MGGQIGPAMRIIAKRLLALEGGPLNLFEHMSDDDLMARINEINGQLMAAGCTDQLKGGCIDINNLALSIAMLQRHIDSRDGQLVH